jgi:hypothetical protein
MFDIWYKLILFKVLVYNAIQPSNRIFTTFLWFLMDAMPLLYDIYCRPTHRFPMLGISLRFHLHL